ncbi:hypothetical protein BD289DRAFT_438290 [Coniella lustricola]|uniref:Uncharacterized protein n=1 Tax=Coniella lustricola TaxID=2025994 RepID=A0A2T3A361_9PEZI|nr:hypothetical protein BD289DRAFT_438290 [Coniella lustricola]
METVWPSASVGGSVCCGKPGRVRGVLWAASRQSEIGRGDERYERARGGSWTVAAWLCQAGKRRVDSGGLQQRMAVLWSARQGQVGGTQYSAGTASTATGVQERETEAARQGRGETRDVASARVGGQAMMTHKGARWEKEVGQQLGQALCQAGQRVTPQNGLKASRARSSDSVVHVQVGPVQS